MSRKAGRRRARPRRRSARGRSPSRSSYGEKSGPIRRRLARRTAGSAGRSGGVSAPVTLWNTRSDELAHEGLEPLALGGSAGTRRPAGACRALALEQARRDELGQPRRQRRRRDAAERRRRNSLKRIGALDRRVEDRERPAPLEEVRRAADLLGDRLTPPAAHGRGAGSSASSSTSSTLSTGWNVIASRTSSGTSSRSAPVALRDDHLGQARGVRGEHLLLQPADREHAALQRDLAGHADRVLHRAAPSAATRARSSS